MLVTARAFAEKMNLDYGTANSLLKFLVLQKQAKEVGKQATLTGKGKPSTIFEMPEQVTLNFTQNIPFEVPETETQMEKSA